MCAPPVPPLPDEAFDDDDVLSEPLELADDVAGSGSMSTLVQATKNDTTSTMQPKVMLVFMNQSSQL